LCINVEDNKDDKWHARKVYNIVCKTAVCWSNFFDTNALVVWMNILSMTNKVLDKPSFSRELHRYDR